MMKMKGLRKSKTTQSGIGLIEILVTVLILTFGLVALARFQIVWTAQTDASKQQAEAVSLAQKKIEELRNFTVLDTTAGQSAYADIASGSETSSGKNAQYTLAWTATESTDPSYKTISMVASWPDRHGVTQSINLSSIIGRVDPATGGMTMIQHTSVLP